MASPVKTGAISEVVDIINSPKSIRVSPSGAEDESYFKETEFKCSFNKLNESVRFRRPQINVEGMHNHKASILSSAVYLDKESAIPSSLINPKLLDIASESCSEENY